MKYEILDKTGKNKRCTVTSLEYNGEFMGESYVLCKVESEVPIDFQTGDYLEYRGEKYEINYAPSVLKKCRASYNRDAFTYDSIKLNSASNDLVKCLFLDYVKEDNLIHYSSLPKFSFFASNVEDLAERIQANLDRLYSGDRKWTVKVSPGCGGKTDVYVAAEQINVWTALGYSYSKFKVPFIIKGRTITIGAASETLNKVFKYGKNNGLYEIESVTEQDADIITRLKVYGSTRNLPNRYYNNLREAYAIVEISRIEYERIDNTHAKCKIFSDNAPEKIGTWSEVRINGEVHKVASRQEFDDNVPSPKECTFIELSKGKYELLSVPVTYEEHHNGLNYEIKMLWHEAMIGTECEVYVEGMLRSTFEVRNSNNRSLCYDKAYAYVRDILLIPAEEIPDFNSFMSSASYTNHGDGNHEYDLKLYHETSVEYELVDSPSPTRFEILYASETSKIGESFLTGNHNGSLLPNNMYAPNLMLPDFPSITLDPYIDSDNIEKYGIREGCVFFDGSNDELEEIFPSIEGMKAENLRDAGIDVSLAEGDNGNLDELADAEKIQDDGAITPGDIIPTFTVTLKDVGFDLAKEIGDDSSISMKSGYCSGREFKIRNCVPTEKNGAKCYLLRCERAEDESNKLYYPYKLYPLQAGDKFVILGIDLPDVYVKAASQRLLREGKEYLSEVDHMKHTYSPKIDEIAMARQHDEAIQSGGISLHDTIKEGMLIRISDEDLFNEELHITIDTLTIKEGESLIPSYEITLKETKEEGTLERMQNKIDAIASGNSVNHAGGTIVNLQGNYLKKDTEDAATALISFLKGLLYGNYKPGESGGALKEDGSAEFDSATIRKGLNIGEFSSINRLGDAVLNSISLRNLFQIGNFSSGESGGQISDNGAAELASLLLRGALEIGKYSAGKSGAKIGEDGAAELLSVLVRGLVTAKGIQSPGFSTGALGTGLCLKMDENGDSYIEVDRMLVRKVAEFIQLVIQEIKHVGGQIVLTPASMKCIRVEDTGSAYRCYFEATDGEKTVENQFVAGDQARAQTFNVKEGMNENVKNTYYWRLVTGVGDNYIDLSKTDCDAGSTVPAAGDEIVQLGNRNDVARQAAIILSAYGNDAPYFKMYRGINSYKLEGKEFVNLSREDVMIISDNIKLSTGETVKEYINGAVGDVQSKVDEVSGKVEDAVERLAEQQNYIAALQKTAEDLQNQIDGAIESYFEKTDPTTSNYPANEWTTEEQKQAHSNDTYTNLSTGKSWKWVKDGDTWKWNAITDTATEKALAAAAKAQDTADGKRRVFVSQPTTGQAYDVGDLWVNATYGDTYKNDLLRCKTAKKENEAFSISHWELASRYTDDTKANEAAEAAREAAEAANAAQEAADEAAATAGEAKTEAQAANTELDNLKSDGTISPVEKTALKQQHADIKAEHGQITTEAGKYSISVTDYEAAYKKADAALTKYTASTPEYITVESDYSDISAYYSKRQTILDTIAAKAKEASDAAKKAADDAAAKAEEAAESASEAAQKAIEAKTAADNAAKAAKNAQTDADEANSMLSDIANDNKLTAQEKQQAKKEWDVIVSEKPKNDASADKFGVSKTAYGSAYTALSTYITPLLSNLSSTSNITGTEFRAKFKAYYDARTDLLNAISAKAKELADNAQEAADAAAESASQAIEDAAAAKNAADKAQADVDAEKERMDEWAADGKFSPSEKKQLKEELARIDGDKTQVTDGYTKYGLGTPTAYNTAYTNYRTAINGVVSSSSETVAIPSDFATKRTAYYTQKSAALTAISDAAKAYADKVVAGIKMGGRNYAWGTTNEKKVTSVAYKENHTDTLGYTTIGLKKGDKVVVSFDYEAKDIVFESNSKISAKFNEYYAYSGFGLVLRGNGKGHHTSSIITLNTHYNSSDPVVETDNGSPFIRFDYIKINPGGYFRVWNFMVNKGTVEADWTPAIEDVNGMIEDAQKAADDAAEAAKNAQADATNANKELANIKSDNLISPIEKTALKQQQADIRSEYGEITANAARYAVSTTAYKSAYDLANAALTKYTASSPEYITVGSDYANISAYYDARKTILDAIAAGAKKAADDATNKANQAVEDAARAGHYYLDLDNDGGPVSCDASGNVTGGFPSSKATVYYGTEPDTGWAFTGAFSGCSGSVNSSTGQITVTGVSADTGTVTVTAKKSGKTDLSAVFSVYKVKAGADGADGTNGVGIKSITNKYAVSASNTTAPTSWSDTVPTMTTTNRYLWNYEIVTYTNSTTSETKKRVIGAYGNTGNTGATGATGVGIKSITEYYLASSASSGVTTSTSGWTTSVQSTSSSKKYLWNYEVVTYTNDTKYTSSPVIIGTYGDKGDTGPQGVQGPKGADGTPRYTWIRYADNASGSGISNSPTGKTYIGFAYNKTTATESNTPSDYTWSLIKGEKGDQGVPGAKGADGKTTYTWIKYSDNSTGSGMYDTPKSTTQYIGIAVNKTTATESNTPSDYTWSKFKGDDGADGKGIKSTAVTYQVSTSGTTPPTGTWNSSIPSVAANQYLWTRTVITYTDNTTSTSYSVGKMGANGAKGDKGDTGPAGADGDGIVSVSNTYQIGSSGTTAPTGSWSATVPSPQKGKYLWTKTVTTYKKSDPTTVYSVSYYGTDGTAAKYVRVAGDQVFIYTNNFSGNPTPTSITLTATLTGTSGYQWSYKQVGQTSFTNISGATSQTYALAHNNSTVWGSAKSVTIRCTSGGVYDEMTIAKVSSGTNGTNGKDGTNGTNGKDGAAGKNGADAYTIILGNESHAFQGTTSAAIAASTKCEVIAYKGATRVAATIGTITGAPSGMSTSISSNGTTSASFTVSVTSSLTTGQGVLTVPITVDGKSFTKNFSFSVAFKGNTGATGATGVGIKSITEYYLASSASSGVTTSTSGWTTSVQSTSSSKKYLWNYEVVTYTNDTKYTSSPVIIGTYGDKGDTGPQGVQGPKGADGTPRYTWIRYADNASGSGISNSPTGKTYIGFAYNKTTATESNTPSDYTWSLIKGEKGDQGVPGAKGADGKTTYTWIKYSDNSTGSGMYDTPKSTTQYIGIAVNKTTATESNTPSDYTWSKFKGDDGADGKGIKSTAVTYQVSTSGTTPPTGTWNSSIPSVAANQYLWTRTVITYTDNTTSTSYSVGKMGANGAKGDKGDTGPAGADGDGIVSVSNTYQIGSSGTTAPTGSWSATVPSPQKGKYLWTKTVTTYKKSDPTTVYSVSYYGTDGTAAKYVRVAGDQVFIYTNNFSGNPTPTSITLTATLTGTSGYQWSYKQVGQTSFTNISGATSQTYALAHNNSTVWGSAKSVTIRCTSGGVYDEMTIAKVSSGTNGTNGKDGTNGTNGKDGAAGKNGADAYTIILGNESHAFQGTTSAAIAASTKCEVIAYKGATRVAATIGTITGAPSGMSTSISSNGTTSASFTVSVTSSLTTGQGVLTVPITVDGKSFTKNFSFSVAFKGNTGATGATGPKGDAAVFYTIEPSANVVKKSWDNKLTPTSVTCTKYKQTGSNARATTTEKTLKYQRVGTDSSVQTAASGSSVTVSPTSTTTSIKFWLYDGSNIIMMQEVPVVGDAVDVYTKVHAEITAAEGEIGLLSTKVTTVTDSVTGLEKEVETNTAEIKSAKGQISSTASQVSSLGTRVSTVEQTASSLKTTVQGIQGDVSTLEQTTSKISLKVDSIWPDNIFPDGSFENGGLANRNLSNCTVSIDTSSHIHGSKSLKIQCVTGNSWVYVGRAQIPVVSGKVYTIVMWIRATSTFTESGGATGAYFSKNDQLELAGFTAFQPQFTSSWTRKAYKVTAPSGSNYLVLRLGTAGQTTSRTLYFDSIMVFEGDLTGSLPSGFVEGKHDGELATGIDVINKKITVTSDQFVIQNNDGEVTASVDADGVLKIGSGEFSGYMKTVPQVDPNNNSVTVTRDVLKKGGFFCFPTRDGSSRGTVTLPTSGDYLGTHLYIYSGSSVQTSGAKISYNGVETYTRLVVSTSCTYVELVAVPNSADAAKWHSYQTGESSTVPDIVWLLLVPGGATYTASGTVLTISRA
ncbi:carbohydrate-binding protein [Paraprevotella clara]|uniref:carbohydrate-binding protein n=1 Tax=Paraprevotella clara TaxID=454154 RepID=UPI0040295ACF